ncbi:DUF1294 domain-containing protein [Neisseria meningitidis]|uniref:DUF1294 domain-containing protein n=1 Tax=Neisseria meningitidis TaxID=487 RepID=UPI001F5D05D1|nr:DUF1294 domain-containing protein [Neisseria meningitidis]
MKRQAFFKPIACAAFLSAVSLRLPVLGACYAILSLYAFALYSIDKRRAVRGKRRIPEHRLLLPALFKFKPVRRCLALPYYLYCLRLRRLVLIFVNPLYYFVPPEFFVKLGQNT